MARDSDHTITLNHPEYDNLTVHFTKTPSWVGMTGLAADIGWGAIVAAATFSGIVLFGLSENAPITNSNVWYIIAGGTFLALYPLVKDLWSGAWYELQPSIKHSTGATMKESGVFSKELYFNLVSQGSFVNSQ